MPYKAIYEGEAKPPQSVPEHTDVSCPDCGEKMHVVKSHERQTGTFVSRHFRHSREHGTGGGGAGGKSCGESDEHIKLKSIAASKLEHIFEDNCWKCELEYTLENTTTDANHRQADAILLFDDTDDQLGQGVAVEVQYKNKDKNKRAVERDYIENNISTVWVTPDDFGDHDVRLNEADIRYRAERSAKRHITEHTSHPALPNGHPPKDHAEFKLHSVRVAREELEGEQELQPRKYHTPATFPEPVIDELRYRGNDWSALFADPPELHFRLQAAIPTVDSSIEVQATFLERMFDEHLYHSNEWHRSAISRTDTAETELVFGAILPLEYLDSQLMKPVKNAPQPPNTPHDDVQCHNCGKYRYAPNAPMKCQSCGTWYNWDWNIQTGRISHDSVPDSVSL
jgi:ssDNA-binding Zn-finger/Zn-ribbon topoisomerase 1